ncbi:MAG: hypothetical protein EXS10_03115 [Phycisphaerales bacterium]|nr:hypothetical protein [Phycisphaerales bacterium]
MKFLWAFVLALVALAAVFFFSSNTKHPIVSAQDAIPNEPIAIPAAMTAPAIAPIAAVAEVPQATATKTVASNAVELVRRIDARTIELAGKYRVTGNGTEADPYRVSWELLMSASQTVDASKGALQPPKWIELLDGMWIEISAYYSTVVRAESVDELLLTFNRWDGCCIGLPPTPFDSIEAKLSQPMRMTGLHLTRYGTFRGKLAVSPFATAGFLLGFYRLDAVSQM